MARRVEFKRSFTKQRDKADIRIQIVFDKRLKLFYQDAHHRQLRNHALTGRWKGFRSIDVTGDWRAIFKEERKRGVVIVTFVALGTHSQLYK